MASVSTTLVASTLTEPINLPEIQGNILAGFNKDHQKFLFLRIEDAAKAKVWLKQVIPMVSDCKKVKAANEERKSSKTAAKAAWLNIAFNYPGLKKLSAPHLSQFPEEFKEGMAARSVHLGDVGSNAPEQWDSWLSDREFLDVMILLAADATEDLASLLSDILSKLPTSGLSLIHIQNGEAPPGDASPNEQFGFRDGISQPGIKGFTESIGTEPTQGAPGQDLLWPGEFVLGYSTQIGKTDPSFNGPNQNPGQKSTNGPDWTENGSFLVFRKLEQDVAAFRNSIRANAAALGVDPEVLGAKVVGRFRTGCPMEKPKAPPNTLDSNDGDPSKVDPQYVQEVHINDFEYGNDPQGTFAPRSAHVRKAYPRDERFLDSSGKALPDSKLNESSTQTHRILRRGIPFGSYMEIPYAGLASHFMDDGVSRGLLFLCYQRSIKDQFEFIQTAWVNDHNFPQAGDGADPVMAQVKVDAMQCPFKGQSAPTTFDLRHFVTTNGGEYFFQPSISALHLLSALGSVSSA